MQQTALRWRGPLFPNGDTQNGRILAYLRMGHSLTPLEALDQFRCMRLGARIWDLRQMGWPIQERRTETSSGKHVSTYWLEAQ